MEVRNSFDRIATVLEHALPHLESLASDVHRIANAVAPVASATVGSRYIADKLGVTTVWVAEMARRGDIPSSCVLPGTGTGKVWKFDRARIDRWIESARRERGTAS